MFPYGLNISYSNNAKFLCLFYDELQCYCCCNCTSRTRWFVFNKLHVYTLRLLSISFYQVSKIIKSPHHQLAPFQGYVRCAVQGILFFLLFVLMRCFMQHRQRETRWRRKRWRRATKSKTISQYSLHVLWTKFPVYKSLRGGGLGVQVARLVVRFSCYAMM